MKQHLLAAILFNLREFYFSNITRVAQALYPQQVLLKSNYFYYYRDFYEIGGHLGGHFEYVQKFFYLFLSIVLPAKYMWSLIMMAFCVHELLPFKYPKFWKKIAKIDDVIMT